MIDPYRNEVLFPLLLADRYRAAERRYLLATCGCQRSRIAGAIGAAGSGLVALGMWLERIGEPAARRPSLRPGR